MGINDSWNGLPGNFIEAISWYARPLNHGCRFKKAGLPITSFQEVNTMMTKNRFRVFFTLGNKWQIKVQSQTTIYYKNENYKVSGNVRPPSLDGLDLAYCHIWKISQRLDFEIKSNSSQVFPIARNAGKAQKIHFPPSGSFAISLHNPLYGTCVWVIQTKEFIKFPPIRVRFIASTMVNTPTTNAQKGLTFQKVLDNICQRKCNRFICDFRTQRIVALGRAGTAFGADLEPTLFLDSTIFGLNHLAV